jgi:serine/threonine-protein kinase
VRLALEGAFDAPRLDPVMTRRHDWLRRPLVPAAALLAGLAIAGVSAWYAMRPDLPDVIRTEIVTSGTSAFTLSGFDRDLAITPDGTQVIYRGQNQLLVRPLGRLVPTALTSLVPSGLSPVQGLFVSPDSQWIGFGSTDPSVQIRKIPITGGPSVTVAGIDGVGTRGATWSEDGTVVFATAAADTGLQHVSAAGGKPVILTRPNQAAGELDHRWPAFLPGGQAVLFTIVPPNFDLNEAQIALFDLRTQQQTVLLNGGHDARYLPSGHLVFGTGDTLRAVPFDLSRLAVTGTPVPVIERISSTIDGGMQAAIAANGTLVYLPGGPESAIGRRLVWVDRAGNEEPIAAPPRPYLYPRLSPDGQRLVVASQDLEQDLWMWDIERATLSRLTFDPAQDIIPTWMPDGRRLLFGSARAGARNIYEQAADGSGVAQRLYVSENFQDATSVSPDGTRIVVNEVTPNQGRDMRLLTLTPTPRIEPLVETRFEERGGILSPDGRWLAYESDSSGRFEIYVRPFPAIGDGQWQVSTAGGVHALWSRSGRELFYRALDGTVLSVPVNAQTATWSAGMPVVLFKGNYLGANVSRQYDVTPDGQRFVMLKESGERADTQRVIVVVQNWFEELRRLAPTP